LIKKERAWIKIPIWVRKINLDSWNTTLSGIRTKVIILHNEKLEGGYYIGPIISLNAKDVKLGWFDGMGNWGNPDRIQYSKITACDFGDRYSMVHSKYLKWT
jgi:hypothetical protein